MQFSTCNLVICILVLPDSFFSYASLFFLITVQEANGMQPSTCNVLICGDFNSGREQCPWRLLQRCEYGVYECVCVCVCV